MTVLGVDLGVRDLAWSVVTHDRGYRVLVVGSDRNAQAHAASIAAAWRSLPPVDRVGSERLFHSAEHPEAFKAEGGMGLVWQFCQERNLPEPVRVLPQMVKQTMTGDLKADKRLVARFVRGLAADPGIDLASLSEHESDAVAIAYTTLVWVENEVRMGGV